MTDRKIGEVIVSVMSGSPVIVKADPLTAISTSLLELIFEQRTEHVTAEGYRFAAFDYSWAKLTNVPSLHRPWTGAILTIEDVKGQRFVYVIGEQVPDYDAYYAEWPD